jgi:predicted O-methyltransferase YrrM
MALDALVVSVENDSETIESQWSREVRNATLRMVGPVVTRLEMGSLEASLHCHNSGMQFDSMFIDASHHYADCKADIEAWLPLLRPGGIISGHDYWAVHPGVMCAVNDVFKDSFKVVDGTRIWVAKKTPM